MMKLISSIILLFLEIVILWSMISFTTKNNYYSYHNKRNKVVLLDNVELKYSYMDFYSSLFSKNMNFNAELEEVSFPSAEGVLSFNMKSYRVIMKRGRIFLNKWGILKGQITVESKRGSDFFRAEGRDFRLDFKKKTIYSGNGVNFETNNISLAGHKFIIDFKNRIILVSGGVRGEIKNFVP